MVEDGELEGQPARMLRQGEKEGRSVSEHWLVVLTRKAPGLAWAKRLMLGAVLFSVQGLTFLSSSHLPILAGV